MKEESTDDITIQKKKVVTSAQEGQEYAKSDSSAVELNRSVQSNEVSARAE